MTPIYPFPVQFISVFIWEICRWFETTCVVFLHILSQWVRVLWMHNSLFTILKILSNLPCKAIARIEHKSIRLYRRICFAIASQFTNFIRHLGIWPSCAAIRTLKSIFMRIWISGKFDCIWVRVCVTGCSFDMVRGGKNERFKFKVYNEMGKKATKGKA